MFENPAWIKSVGLIREVATGSEGKIPDQLHLENYYKKLLQKYMEGRGRQIIAFGKKRALRIFYENSFQQKEKVLCRRQHAVYAQERSIIINLVILRDAVISIIPCEYTAKHKRHSNQHTLLE